MTHYPPPYSQPPMPPPAPKPSTARQWAVPLVVVGVVVAGIITAALVFTTSDTTDSGASSFGTQLETAREYCMVGELADDGHTLVIDMRGEELGTGSLSSTEVGCLLGQLGTPAHITSRMDSTRALDGMQDASWDGLTATWTYHPDDGLDIIVTDN